MESCAFAHAQLFVGLGLRLILQSCPEIPGQNADDDDGVYTTNNAYSEVLEASGVGQAQPGAVIDNDAQQQQRLTTQGGVTRCSFDIDPFNDNITAKSHTETHTFNFTHAPKTSQCVGRVSDGCFLARGFRDTAQYNLVC